MKPSKIHISLLVFPGVFVRPIIKERYIYIYFLEVPYFFFDFTSLERSYILNLSMEAI
jgi:hypothetical protein